MEVTIRTAKQEDLEAIYAVETACFPVENQLSYDYYKRALKTYPDEFFLLFVDRKLVGFINAMPTDEKDLKDSMFDDVLEYKKDGKNLIVIGLMVLSEYRGKGYAARLVRRLIRSAREKKRKHIILTCKKELIDFYKKFAFEYQGISSSTLGSGIWHQLCLTIDDDDDYQ
jgi:ribosomal protein S18 acetylase RimI-like enzyme